MNPAADALWTWLTVSVFLVGAVTTFAAVLYACSLAWRGYKAEREDAKALKQSAERAADEQAGKVVGMR